MAGNILTQDAKAVRALIEFVTGKPCRKMPATFALANGAQLTRSSKSDCYYMTTPKACSCPGFTYHRACKHVKAIKTEAPKMSDAQAYQARKREAIAEARASSIPEPEESLIRREGFRPVIEEAA